jgi:hypothetical protein
MNRNSAFWGVLFVTWACGSLSGAAHAQQTGVTEGVLTAKGEAWIAVRADNAEESTKLVPCWVGGLPRNGGGLDKRMLALFQQLVIGSRLKVAWVQSERLCVTKIQVLSLPGEEDGNSKTEEPPAQKSGNFTGIVTEKGENWIKIRPDGQQESRKFLPRWIGGTPAQGGGLDKDALRAIHDVTIGTSVSVSWIWDEHYRLTAMNPTE